MATIRYYDLVLRICLAAVLLCVRAHAAAPPTVDRALDQMYNFDFRAAHETLDRVIAERPSDPLPFAFRASAHLFSELDRLGILESEFLIDDKRIAEKKNPPKPDPRIRDQFQKAIGEAETRGEAALKTNANDVQALFALSISGGLVTDYMALVEKRQFMSLSTAKKSNAYAQRLLKLDPKFYDAYLTAGLSEYMIGSLPFFIRWFVHFDNVSGNKDRGVQNLELTAREGRYFRPFAKILLGIISLREKKPQQAQKLLTDLNHDYPSNPLFQKELSKLNEKFGPAGN